MNKTAKIWGGWIVSIIVAIIGIFSYSSVSNKNELSQVVSVNINGELVSVETQELQNLYYAQEEKMQDVTLEKNQLENNLQTAINEKEQLKADLKDANTNISALNETVSILRENVSQLEFQLESNVQNQEKTVLYNGALSLMQVCKPYQTSQGYEESNEMLMSGKSHRDGFLVRNPKSIEENFLLFNLEGKYLSMEFDLGLIDGSWIGDGAVSDGTFVVYVDGIYIKTIEKPATELVTKESIELNYGQQLRLEYSTGSWSTRYGFANIVLFP